MTVNPPDSAALSPTLAVTTAVNPTPELEARARGYACELGIPYLQRRNVTVNRIYSESGIPRLLVVFPDKIRLIDVTNGLVYFYHPNMLLVRGFNILRGSRDLFAKATGLTEGESCLDCTVGFATEAALACLLVGPTGSVTGLESVPELALVTREGVASFKLETKVLQDALRQVKVVCSDYRDFLATAASDSYDVVYFDPFFEERVEGSENSVSPLAMVGNTAPLDEPSVLEAMRVARRRVVIKHPWYEPLPETIKALVTRVVSTRKTRLAYSVIEV